MNKKITILILLFLFLVFFASGSDSTTGIAKVFDNIYIGKQMSSGIIYNPDEYVAGSNRFDYFSVLLLENLTNNKKTIVYIIDNTKPKNPDTLLFISPRAAKELGEITRDQFPVKVTLLKKINKEEYLKIINKVNTTAQKNIIKNKFYIQVGAYSLEKNVNEVKNRLIDFGFNVIIKKVTLKNKVLYKILVGPYSYEESKDVINLVKKLGFNDCFIIKM